MWRGLAAVVLIVGGLAPAASRADNPKPALAKEYYERGFDLAEYKHNYPAAERELTKAIELDPSYLALMERAEVRAHLGRSKEAEQDLTTILDNHLTLAPDWVYSKRGVIRLAVQDNDGALADFGKAIETSGDALSYHPPGDSARLEILRRQASYYSQRGLVWSKKGEPRKALADFDQAVTLDSKNADYRLNRALAYIGSRDFRAALPDCDKAIELRPDFEPAYAARAWARMHVGDWTGVLADAEKTLQLDPNDPYALRARGLARIKLGKAEEGRNDLRLAVQMHPSLKPLIDQEVEEFLGKPAASTAGRNETPK